MKTISIGEKTINIPQSWGEITLRTYLEICKLEAKKSSYVIEDLYIIELLQKILGDAIDLDDLTIEEFNEVASAISAVISDREHETKTKIEIDGVEFRFIDIKKIKIGEFVSIKTIAEGKDIYDVMPDILAILIRPVVDDKIEKYDPEKSEERAEMFKDKLMISDFLWGIDFFLSGNNLSTTNMKDTSIVDQNI